MDPAYFRRHSITVSARRIRQHRRRFARSADTSRATTPGAPAAEWNSVVTVMSIQESGAGDPVG
jgi:hypothetical protein